MINLSYFTSIPLYIKRRVTITRITSYNVCYTKLLRDGLYSWDELKILKEKFKDQLVVISIVVDKKHRYSRLETREIRPLTNLEAETRDIIV